MADVQTAEQRINLVLPEGARDQQIMAQSREEAEVVATLRKKMGPAWQLDGTVEGSVGFAEGRFKDKAFAERFAANVASRAREETDIYQMAAGYGTDFDPLALNLHNARLHEGGQINVQITDTGWISFDYHEGELVTVAGYAQDKKANVATQTSTIGLKQFVDYVFYDNELAKRPLGTAAHEAAHLGGEQRLSDAAIDTRRKLTILLFPLVYLDIATGVVVGREQDFAHAAYKLQREGSWRQMDEIIARVAESDFGYAPMDGYQQIAKELQYYKEDRADYSKRHSADSLEGFVRGVTERVRALNGLGLSGWEINRLVLERAVDKKLHDLGGALGAGDVLGVLDEQLAASANLPGKMDEDTMYALALRAESLANLRHAKLQRIILETTRDILQDEWSHAGGVLLNWGDSMPGNVALAYVDREILPQGVRNVVKFTYDMTGIRVAVLQFDTGFHTTTGPEDQQRLDIFESGSAIDAPRVARDFVDSLDEAQRTSFKAMFADQLPNLDNGQDISRGRVAIEIYKLLGGHEVENLEMDGQTKARDRLDGYLKGKIDSKFVGSVDALPRVRYGELSKFAENFHAQKDAFVSSVASEINNMPAFKTAVESVFGPEPHWDHMFLTMVANRENFMRFVIQEAWEPAEAIQQLQNLAGRPVSETAPSEKTLREAAVIIELSRVMGSIYHS